MPFQNIYIDHCGPYNIAFGGKKQKIYILILTCLFTRAFNLQICLYMTVNSFLRALQLHVHKYGLPERVTSDFGSTLIAGGNVVMDFLKDGSNSQIRDSYKKLRKIRSDIINLYRDEFLGKLMHQSIDQGNRCAPKAK